MGTKHAVGVQEQTKASPLLDHKETVPTRSVHIGQPDRTGELMRRISKHLIRRVNEFDSDSFALRLIQPERNAGTGMYAPLEHTGPHRRPLSLDIVLMQLQLELCLLLSPGPQERLGQKKMCR